MVCIHTKMETVHFPKQYFFIRRHMLPSLLSFQTYFQHLLLSIGFFFNLKGSFVWFVFTVCAFQSACGLLDFTLKVEDLVLTSVAWLNTLVSFSSCSEMSESCFPETVSGLFVFLFSQAVRQALFPSSVPLHSPVP